MGYFVSIILLFIGIYNHKKGKAFSSPETLFCYEWAFICGLASLRLFGMYSVSMKTWLIIFVGSIFFLLGVKFGKRLMIRNNIQLTLQDENNLREKNGHIFFWIVLIVLYIYTVSQFVTTLGLLRSGYSLGQIRNAQFGLFEIAGYTRSSSASGEFVDLFFSTLEIFLVGFGINEFFVNIKNNKKFIISVLGLEVINSFTTGSRFVIAYFIVEVLACLSLYRSSGWYNYDMSIKTKRIVKRIVAFMLAVIVIISIIRVNDTSQLLAKYYRYICGNVVFFDQHINTYKIAKSYFGMAGIYGLWSIIFPLAHNFLGVGYPLIYLNTISEVLNTQTFLKIADNMYTNAFITPFYAPYADFGIFGVMFGMFIFGLLCGFAYKKAIITMNKRLIVAYLIFCQMIFKTIQFYPFTSQLFVVSLIVIFFWSERRVSIGIH